MKAPTLIRLLLSLILLWQVWTHAHWSVALCLTLIFVAREFEGYAMGRLVDAVKAQRQKEEQQVAAIIQEIVSRGNKTDQSN